MRKTNILVEVEDDLYENIVLPYKKKKSFSKLVVSLLRAYYENESIYSYINGEIDGLDNEANEELLKDLQQMSLNLSSLGMLQNEAEVIIDNGKDMFNSVPKEPPKGEIKDKGIADIKDYVDTVISNRLKNIEDLIRKSLDSGVGVSDEVVRCDKVVSHKTLNFGAEEVFGSKEKVVEIPQQGFSKPSTSAFDGVVADRPVSSPYMNNLTYNPKSGYIPEDDYSSNSSESEQEAENALSSLLGSIGM